MSGNSYNNKIEKVKMKNDKENFKIEFKRRIYKFILQLIKITELLEDKKTVDRIFISQIIRSVTSIGANYIEAQAASSKKDFINFIHHSLKSANETKFWLALIRDTNKLPKEKVNELLSELIEISNILGASLLTLKGKRN